MQTRPRLPELADVCHLVCVAVDLLAAALIDNYKVINLSLYNVSDDDLGYDCMA